MKKCTVEHIEKLTAASVEITFSSLEDLSHTPGAFVMVEIPHIREDEAWKIVTIADIYTYIQENTTTTLEHILQKYPYIEEKTALHFIDQLLKQNTIEKIDDYYYCTATAFVTPPERPLKRAYSLSSTGADAHHISTMVKEMPYGCMSHYLVHRLRVGDEVLVSEPLGHFLYPKEMVQDVLLIGAGSGITPLLGIIRSLKEREIPPQATLLYSNTTQDSIIGKKELDLLEHHNHIKITHTLTREEVDSSWKGRRGRIDAELLTTALQDLSEPLVFICGNLAFAKNMHELLIGLGVPKERIKREAYG